MYSFTKLNEAPTDDDNRLKTLFGGDLASGQGAVNLDDEIEGFRTLTVTGRGVYTPDVKLINKTGGDGAFIDTANYPARIIEVKALLEHENGVGYVARQLNAVLRKEMKWLRFTDDLDVMWRAIPGGFVDEEDKSHSMTVVIRFACPDPYGYSTVKTTTAAVSADTMFPIRPENLTVTVGAAADRLKITAPANGMNIVFEHAVSANDKLRFSWYDGHVKCTLNGVNALRYVTMQCDIDTFEIKGGDTLTTVPSSTYSMQYRTRVI